MATTLIEALGDRIEPVSVVLKTGDEMPERSDGGPSFGFWKAGQREIWLWEETDEYPVDKTFAHEAMHVVDTDWLTRGQRLDIIELMSPTPTAWGDQSIGGVIHKYVALPFEVFAVYASAAIGGFQRPAYMALFKRRVTVDKWPTLAELTLRDDGPADRMAEVVDAVASPPDPMAELQAQLLTVRTKLAEAVAAKETAELGRAAAESKLSTAKNKAAEIRAL